MKPRRTRRSASGFAKELFALAAVIFTAGCPSPPKQPPWAVSDAGPDARIQAIPAADPTKYADRHEMKAWRNPYLIIRKDAVALLDLGNHEEHILKPNAVLDALSRLPASAWPLGRVVAIEESRADSDQDKIAIRRNRAIVAGTLEGDHVAIQWIPQS